MNEDQQVTKKIQDAIAPLQTEISERNAYIQRRDDFIYGQSLMSSIANNVVAGGDKTPYNWLERVVDIHVSQLMGRSFQMYSTYNKRDLSMADDINDPQQKQQDIMINKRLKANADARRDFCVGIIRDNGGEELFQLGAQSGSAFGFTVYKSWLGLDDNGKVDTKKPWNMEMIENLNNFYALWSSDNFREVDGYVYMDQISITSANSTYGDYLEEGESFITSLTGNIGQNPNPANTIPEQGTRPMVDRIEFTGKLECIRGDDGDLYECQPGDETEVNILTVGGKIVRIVTEEDHLPRYKIIPNQKIVRRPWGLADVSETCIEVNRTYLERMSDWITLGNKVLYPKWSAINFDTSTVPKPKSRTAEMIPMDQDQSIKLIDAPTQFGYEYPKLIDQLTNEFIRAARISRVLFDDPAAAASNSNQALMTSMKGTIDAVEKKQQIWQAALTDMFEDALRTLGKNLESVKSFVDEDDWKLYVKWPSVLRKEDPVYQQMLINRFNIGSLSVETLLEEEGVMDPGEELDRIRDNMSDPVTAAIMGRQLPVLAQQVITPPPDPNAPKEPEIKHTVNWRADLTPQQEANLASTMPGFQDGPFGMSMGPQGNQGLAAQENTDNAGFLNGNPFKGGTAITKDEKGNPIPNPAVKKDNKKGVDSKDGTAPPSQVATPDANNPAAPTPASLPGSGAPTPVSPQGAINQTTQNNGG